MENVKKILIVEDDLALRMALLKGFRDEGFETHVALNGEEGLKMALDQRPDMILLDVMMPKMDGLTMLEKIREDVWGKTAKVILLTNSTDLQSVAGALEKQVAEYLIKSDWDLADIIKKVKLRLGVGDSETHVSEPTPKA